MTDIPIGGTAAAARVFPFSRWRRAGFFVVFALLALALGALASRGLSLGLDFTGGAMVEARHPEGFDLAALRARLAEQGAADAVLQLSDQGRAILVRLQTGTAAALDGIRAALPPGAEIRAADQVGPKVSGELLRSGLLACLAAVSVIAIYVWLRFEAKFGVAAFLTTFHDVALMVGFFAVTGLTFDLTSVAALLLIAGYSINDTVVVFDRVREMILTHRDADLAPLVDRAITDTLRRTLMTSGTTLATSVALMIFGGPVLFGFSAAVTFGIVAGTLSSIFIAAPLLLHLPGRLPGQALPEGPPGPDPA